MTFLKRFLLLLGFLSLSQLGLTEVFAQGKLRIVVSVDWEGEDLQAANMQAMEAFRSDYPGVPLQHFLNAAYYTKPGADARLVTRSIQSVLRRGDEHGLHIHAWRSLVQAAGVQFRIGPSFVDQDVDLSACGDDCGVDVALNAYGDLELRKIIRTSVQILQNQGFQRAVSFRAGGWQADDTVLNALAAEGFTLDSSATYAPYLREAWGEYNLYPFVGQLWPQTTPTSQPYRYQTKAGLSIVELPNNGCLADYMTGAAMLKAFVKNANILKRNPSQNQYLSIGFHQETAADYLPQLRSGIDQILRYARMNKIPYEFIVAPL